MRCLAVDFGFGRDAPDGTQERLSQWHLPLLIRQLPGYSSILVATANIQNFDVASLAPKIQGQASRGQCSRGVRLIRDDDGFAFYGALG